jgi:hypothetical protein
MSSAGAQVPIWVVLVIAVGSPLLAFCGVVLAQWLTRKTANESEIRWQREETMRMLRWAADLASEQDPNRSAVGIAALDALDDSPLLQPEDQLLISAVLEAIVAPLAEQYDVNDEVQED